MEKIKKILMSLLVILTLSALSVQAQSTMCGFEKIHKRQLELQADYSENIQMNKDIILDSKRRRSKEIHYRDEEDVISIPTVVHIIYTDSVETNIPDEQVYSAIAALNDDFRKRNGGNGVDTEIEFCLASYDPNGNPTDGINRVHCTGDCAMGYDTICISPDLN